MNVSASQKPTAAGSFDAAREAYRLGRSEFAALKRERDAAVAAAAVVNLEEKDFRHVPERRELGLDYLRRHHSGWTPKVHVIAEEIEELDKQLQAAGDRLISLKENRRRAQQTELALRVQALRPRHRAVIRKIAAALDALAEGLEEENALQKELAATGVLEGLDRDTGLFNSAIALGMGTREKLRGAIGAWGRDAHRRGLA